MYRLIRAKELTAICVLSKSALYRAIRANEFPKAVRITHACVAWRSDEIAAWLESRQRVE
jgi:prophage regulatory protein